MAQSELDTRADTICAGKNMRVLNWTGQTCSVKGFHSSYDALSDIPIARCATGVTINGYTYILVFNEALYFGETMDHSLINPNQIRITGIDVCDNPFDRNTRLGIDHEDVFVPFRTQGSTVYFESFVPSEDDLHDYPHIVLTDDKEWDPTTVVLPQNQSSDEEEFLIQAIDTYRQQPLSETDNVLASISESLSPQIAAVRMIEEVYYTKGLGPRQESEMVSKTRHSQITPEHLSRAWNIGIETAKKTLHVTTQRGVRHAIHPLHRRYRVDHLDLHRKYLKGQFYADYLESKVKSINQNNGAFVITNGDYTEVYPTSTRSSAADALLDFCDNVGIPERLKTDLAPEFAGKRTEFGKVARRNGINLTFAERGRENQVFPVDLQIRELKKRWHNKMTAKGAPSRVWDYGLKHQASISNFISRGKSGRTGYEKLTGETPDISEYCDFDFWDLVWCFQKKHPGVGEADRHLGRWAGISHRVGSDMCYWIIPVSGTPISRTTVQHVTLEDMRNPEIKKQIDEFDRKLNERMDDTNFTNPEATDFAIQDLEDDQAAYGDGTQTPGDEEYGDMVKANERPEEDDVDAYDKYIGAEVFLDDRNDGGAKATVKRRVRDPDGKLTGKAHRNPLLDTREYELEFEDGTTDRYFANTIAESLFSQIDSEGRQYVLLKEIVDHKRDNSAIHIENGYDISHNGNKVPKKTTRGWKLLVEWKDGGTDWIDLKDLKDSNPLELAEYAVANKLTEEPAFKWWCNTVLRRRNRIISKVKSKYWRTTHKYGIRLPKSVDEALRFDEETGTDFWAQAIKKEMSKVRVALKVEEDVPIEDIRSGKAKEFIGFQEITCHMVFDIKMDFTRKARFVAGGHTTEAPASITYSSVVSRDSVKLAFLIAALNDLDVMSCDIGNAYLNAPCREKIWFQGGAECGEHVGKVIIIVRALYGLKSSGASWRSMFSASLESMGFKPTRVDPDVYIRKNHKADGVPYYEIVLVYVDDVLAVSSDPEKIMRAIGEEYELKDGEYGQPEIYLGAGIEKFQLPSGKEVWSMTSEKYVKAAVETIKALLEEDGREFKAGKRPHKGPLPPGYKPELDTTKECGPEHISRFQQIIGILRWAIELGRIDIHIEVALLSQYQAAPREGHLEALYLIVHYLWKNPVKRIVFDPEIVKTDESCFSPDADWKEFYGDVQEEDPPNMPEPLGKPVKITCFVDADHAGNTVTRRSHTGVLIFVNNAPIISYSKRQNTVESSTFGSELVAMRIARDMIVALRIKLKMFGVPIEGPADVLCDNQGVVKNTSIPESTLNKKHNSINYHVIRESAAAGVLRVGKEDTESNLADFLTKLLPFSRKQGLFRHVLWEN